MKTKSKSSIRTTCHLFDGAFCAVAVMLISSSAQAQNLFMSELGADNNIYEFTPSGVQSTFASGLNFPYGLAFNSAGDLFATSWWNGNNIYEFTPSGVQSTFASGLNGVFGLTFQPEPTPEPSALALLAAGAAAFFVRRRNLAV